MTIKTILTAILIATSSIITITTATAQNIDHQSIQQQQERIQKQRLNQGDIERIAKTMYQLNKAHQKNHVKSMDEYNPEEMQDRQEKAREKAVKIIEKNGFTVENYQQIQIMAQNDVGITNQILKAYEDIKFKKDSK